MYNKIFKIESIFKSISFGKEKYSFLFFILLFLILFQRSIINININPNMWQYSKLNARLLLLFLFNPSLKLYQLKKKKVNKIPFLYSLPVYHISLVKFWKHGQGEGGRKNPIYILLFIYVKSHFVSSQALLSTTP